MTGMYKKMLTACVALLLLFAVVLVINGCKKSEGDGASTDVKQAQEKAEGSMEDANSTIEKKAEEAGKATDEMMDTAGQKIKETGDAIEDKSDDAGSTLKQNRKELDKALE